VLSLNVTNESSTDRAWHVEPYGDEVLLAPDDRLVVEFEHTADIAFDVTLYEDGTVVWTNVTGDVVTPHDIKRNGESVWPSVQD
jgi:hypothetical protein